MKIYYHRLVNVALISIFTAALLNMLSVRMSFFDLIASIAAVIYTSFPFDGTERHRTVITLIFIGIILFICGIKKWFL